MATLAPYRRRPLRSLRADIERLFSELPTPWTAEEDDAGNRLWAPRIDVSETDAEYHLSADLPGINREDVQISIEEGYLTLRGERREEMKDESENYLRMERRYGSFYRSLPLPAHVDAGEAKASFDNGVLHVRIPKTRESQPRHIPVS